MRIGIDLDNTLACHDATFGLLAAKAGLPDSICRSGKNAVRNYLQSAGRGGEWTAMQGRAYGDSMSSARPFPGALEFLRLARVQGHELFIVSHRTRHPLAGETFDLHHAASAWLDTHGFAVLARVFLETEMTFKARRILDLSCEVFIDDLPEFLTRQDLSAIPRKILFQPEPGPEVPMETVRSWNDAAALQLA
jgi:hypothetical protein